MSIASELQDKIDAKAAIKASIEAKGVTVGDVKLNQYASKVDAIAQDPSIPVGVGQHLVTFYDFDGKVLKRQRVNTGEDATAPAIPTHQYLTFAEWNNPFTNVQSDIDTGAIYNTTDGKTYLFITLTPVTGLAPTLYFSKSSTSLMTIDWGDGTTLTSTTSGNQSINHVYATAGDYIITVDNSAGGTFSFGNGSETTTCFFGYVSILTKLYLGNNITEISSYAFYLHLSLKFVSVKSAYNRINISAFSRTSIEFINYPTCITQSDPTTLARCYSLKMAITRTGFNATNGVFSYCHGLTKAFIGSNVLTLLSVTFFQNYALKQLCFDSSLTSIAANSFNGCIGLTQYVFLSSTPPTLANIDAFSGINPICKIYVPDASVEAYKAATNWSFYANYIYPLSEKPQSDE